jgi:hypothetical protein
MYTHYKLLLQKVFHAFANGCWVVASNNATQDCALVTADCDFQPSPSNLWLLTDSWLTVDGLLLGQLVSSYKFGTDFTENITSKSSSIVEWCVKWALAQQWPRYCLRRSVFWLPWKCVDQPLPSNRWLFLLNYFIVQPSCHSTVDTV